MRIPRPALCSLQPSYPQCLSVMRVIVWAPVLANPLSELLSLLLILLLYPLTVEVAKVDSLISYLSSKLPVLSPFSYPTPLVSKNLLCPVISACTQAPQSHMSVRCIHSAS